MDNIFSKAKAFTLKNAESLKKERGINKLFRLLAICLTLIALLCVATASMWIIYQPKEPKRIK